MSAPSHIKYKGATYRRRCRVAVWEPSKGEKNFSAASLLEAFPDLSEGVVNQLAEDAKGVYGKNASAFLEKADTAIGGFGVEAVRSEGAWDSYYGDVVAEYVNTGDTYNATLLHDIEDDEIYLTTYGDWVQAWEYEKEKEDNQ